MGELLARWTIRLALLLYGASLWLQLRQVESTRAFTWARRLWSLSLALLITHVVLAFAVFHGWSHQAAYQFTAQQTADLFGWNWGGGIYVNYLFMLVWAMDVGWWWLAADARRHRPRWLSGLVHGFLLFIWVQASIVFASGISRWLGVAVVCACACARTRMTKAKGQRPKK